MLDSNAPSAADSSAALLLPAHERRRLVERGQDDVRGAEDQVQGLSALHHS